MAENKVKFGLSNVHVAKITEENGEITYGVPFAIPGAVSLAIDAEGDSSNFYADDIAYFTQFNNNGYSGDLEVALIPEQFYTDILGQVKDANGALIESADDTTSSFALMCEIKGDQKKRRIVFYNCSASRPNAEMNTVEESIEPKTDKISITVKARGTDNQVKTTLEPTTENQEVYDTFFTKVYEKDAEAGV